MPKTDKRVDAYIEKSAEFAQPILNELRDAIHEACPDVEETMKWSMPFFMFNGGPICHFASFKQHCAVGFWKYGDQVLGADRNDDAMGHLGRITSAKDLPSHKTLVGYVRKSMQAAAEKQKNPPKPKPKKAAKELKAPNYLLAAVKKNKEAAATWEKFSPSHRNEYVEWITEAKQEETRERRMAQMMEWLAEGKSRNWKYAKC